MVRQQRKWKAWAKWRKLAAAQARSGEMVAPFCRKRRLCVPHFYWWKKRSDSDNTDRPVSVKASGRLREAAEPQFVEVKLPSPAAIPAAAGGDPRVEVRLRNGRSLLVGPGFDTEHVRALLADAYGGYNGVVAGNAITRAGCWSHARRKFVEAEKTAPEIAGVADRLIAALFAVEKQGGELSAEQRHAFEILLSLFIRLWPLPRREPDSCHPVTILSLIPKTLREILLDRHCHPGPPNCSTQNQCSRSPCRLQPIIDRAASLVSATSPSEETGQRVPLAGCSCRNIRERGRG